MSRRAELLVDPKTGVKEQSYVGFSWPNLFFGVFWFLYKRIWGWAVISFLASVVTSGIAWFIFPFFANGLHRSHLKRAGWLPEVQAQAFTINPDSHVLCPDCKELVRKEARVCKHCKATLVPQA